MGAKWERKKYSTVGSFTQLNATALAINAMQRVHMLIPDCEWSDSLIGKNFLNSNQAESFSSNLDSSSVGDESFNPAYLDRINSD
ncbi:MAG: hypothetical protein KAR54_03700 [Candidatus Pacebacteria bacterium]|nr:hypothetical protein [Candidatus Paceibacterota bacterium]